MKVLELFAGSMSVGKAFKARGHEVYSIDWDSTLPGIDKCADIMTVTAQDIFKEFGKPDVIWASPDCTSYSVAAIGHHRKKNRMTGNLDPVTDYAKYCDQVNAYLINLIKEIDPKFYFIENPRGGMRKMSFMKDLPRYTVCYCKYGDIRMKPTDIWTNHPDPKFKPPCKNGDPCHIRAPRGARTGTQGLDGAKKRAVIPRQLCEHVVDICEEMLQKERENMEDTMKKTLTIRQLINILIDAPNKDGEVEVEYIQKEVEGNDNGFEWNQLAVISAVPNGAGCILEAHPKNKEE